MRGLSVSGSFCLLLSALLFWDEKNLVPLALSACLLHELGHVLALWSLGGRVARLDVTAVGAELIPQRVRPFSDKEEVFLLLSGAGMNLLCVWALSFLPQNETVQAFSLCHLLLAVCNLLPLEPLDGGRVLRLCLWHFGAGSLVIYDVLSFCLRTLLLGLGVLHLLYSHGNPSLFILSLWLFWAR